MDSICKFMRDNYRWGIKEFLHAYITEEADEQLSDSVQTRVRKLNEAIHGQQEVLKAAEYDFDLLRSHKRSCSKALWISNFESMKTTVLGIR